MLDLSDKLPQIVNTVRLRSPLIQHITNDVTITMSADLTAAAGASPVMARHSNDAVEMVEAADTLVLNMGTPRSDTEEVMIKAGEKANHRGIPVLFDPVGVGATARRQQIAKEVLRNISVNAIRANEGEIAALLGKENTVRGVDAKILDGYEGTSGNSLAKQLESVVVSTGQIDRVADEKQVLHIEGGDILMGRTVGTGCMLSTLIGIFMAVSDPFSAAVAALCTFDVAGLRVAKSARGPTSFRSMLIDEVYGICSDIDKYICDFDSLKITSQH